MHSQAQQQAGKVEVNLFHGVVGYIQEISNGMPLYRWFKTNVINTFRVFHIFPS
jgi:hypothetical protein